MGTSGLVAQQAIATYYCPSRRRPRPHGSGGFYRCDYVGNAGERGPGNVRSAASSGLKGVVIQTGRWQIQLEGILDGTSNTLMIGEKALHPRSHGTDGGDNERWNNTGWDEDVIRFGGGRLGNGTTYGIPPIKDKDASWNNGGWTPITDPGGRTYRQWHPFFGSSHPGTTTFCLADGSVRSISFDVDSEIFRRVSLANDGESVDLD
jgi:hypothetical protein